MNDDVQQARVNRLATLRFNHVFRAAWRAIAIERGWLIDNFLSTSSHGTISVRDHFRALGV